MVRIPIKINRLPIFHLRDNAAGIRTIMGASPAHNFCSHRSPHGQSIDNDFTTWQTKSDGPKQCVRHFTIRI
jgi:hypothetical protein